MSDSESLVMDVEDSEKRFSQMGEDDHSQMSDHHSKQYTVISLPIPQSEHEELATTVLNSSGPKINCPVSEAVQMLPDDYDWPADHTAIC